MPGGWRYGGGWTPGGGYRAPDNTTEIDGGLPELDLERMAGVRQAGMCAVVAWIPIGAIVFGVYYSTRSLAGVSWLLIVGLVLAAVLFTVGFLSDRRQARRRRAED
ncbi:MAG: hypothetical protein E6J00_13965 [Chloroflexi bacterium]|nr:MAG: hypothetical protein E6J00_13965 [Chloroflexota bacterium]